MSLDFLVDRQDLARFRWLEPARGRPIGSLAPGAALLGIERFAFTANNITYARCGDAFDYWRYFTAPAGWGRIPVWGIARVIAGNGGALDEGERVYGFLPMSTHLIVEPERATATAFIDGAAHRAALPPTYNEYVRIDRDPAYEPATADLHLVLRPLFSLSFFLAEHLRDKGVFGARRVIVSSASSKTALGLAFLLKGIAPDVEIVGLTGPTNLPSTERLGRYDRVLTYDRIDGLASDGPAVFVDIAGDARILANVHRRLGPSLARSIGVGLTRGAAPGVAAAPDLPGPPPEFFFTPSHILARRQDWGADELRRRLAAAWTSFLAEIGPRLEIVTSTGPGEVERIYAEVLGGRTPPDRAHILAFEGA
jgi:hypothetical protein